MSNSSQIIFDALKEANPNWSCGVDAVDEGERVYTGFQCGFNGKELRVLVSFVTESSDLTVSRIDFSFDGAEPVKCSDRDKGLQVCNKLNNYVNAFYTFGIKDDNSLFAKCVFPPEIDKGKFAVLLYSLFVHQFKEVYRDELAKCL